MNRRWIAVFADSPEAEGALADFVARTGGLDSDFVWEAVPICEPCRNGQHGHKAGDCCLRDGAGTDDFCECQQGEEAD